MDGRWQRESEGLTARIRPDGRTEWVEVNPPCPNGCGLMRPDTMRCADCGFTCRHWTCPACKQEKRDPRHKCDPDAKSRVVDQHRR